MTWVREAAVAGRFYPGEAARLEAQVRSLLGAERPSRRVTLLIGPHAGWMYSGGIAGATYARVDVPRTAIVLCPNHTGRGALRSLWARGGWRLPGCEVPIDETVAAALVDVAGLEPDRAAHLGEHSAEVHVPFLRERQPDVRIVPVCLGPLGAAECEALGNGLARAIASVGRDVLIVASTDLSHYVPVDVARRLDGMALDRALALDARGLHAVVHENDISMCGVVPTTVALHAAVALGATRGELVRYGSSGDVSGDFERVVGYAGLIFD